MLEEERLDFEQLLTEREERLRLAERKNCRLELQAAKQGATVIKQHHRSENTVHAEEKAAQDHYLVKELEATKSLAAQRLSELDRMEADRSSLRNQNIQLQEQVYS